MKKILVLGGTGTTGSQVTSRLLESGFEVRILTSSEEKIKTLPTGAIGYVGNLNDKSTLTEAFSGIDGLFLLNALSHNETEQGMTAFEMAKSAGVKKIVYLSVFRGEQGKHIPHFGSKLPIENVIKASGIAYVILQPNNFFQNDYWYLPAFKDYKVYPQPLGSKGSTRVDVRDIADAALNAFKSNQWDNTSIPLNGSEVLTPEIICKIYSEKLGETINYMGDDLIAWAQMNKQFMPEWMVEDLVIMYTFFQENGFNATEEELKTQESIIGHEPRKFSDFVDEIVPAIKG